MQISLQRLEKRNVFNQETSSKANWRIRGATAKGSSHQWAQKTSTGQGKSALWW
jgi:hypothetical protein